MLDATPAQMGLLQAAGTAPALVLGLMAGVWVDRYRRRPLLVAADLGRALLLGAIPLLSLMGLLRIEALIAVALLTGILTLFFDVASTSFVPSFLSRTQLVDGNSKLTASTSVAAVAGPSLGGTLVQLLSAPIAVAADAFSFLVSAVCHALLRVDEPAPRPHGAPSGAEPGAGQGSSGARGGAREVGIWGQLWAELLEGLRVVGANGYLRACAGTAGVFNFFAGIFFTVYVLYVTRELGVSAAALGLLYAVGGVGSVLGAVVAAPLAQRAGFGVATVGAACLVGVGWLPAALVTPGAPLILPILASRPLPARALADGVRDQLGQPAPGRRPRPAAGAGGRDAAGDLPGHRPPGLPRRGPPGRAPGAVAHPGPGGQRGPPGGLVDAALPRTRPARPAHGGGRAPPGGRLSRRLGRGLPGRRPVAGAGPGGVLRGRQIQKKLEVNVQAVASAVPAILAR